MTRTEFSKKYGMKRFEYVEKSIEKIVLVSVENEVADVYEYNPKNFKSAVLELDLDIEMLYKTCKAYKEKSNLSKGFLIYACGTNGGKSVAMTTPDDYEDSLRFAAMSVWLG